MIMLIRSNGHYLSENDKKSNRYRQVTFILAFFLIFTLNQNIISVKAETESETKWVLDHVNVGEGGEIRVPDGNRAEGSFEIWDVSQTSIHYHSRQLDHWGADDYTDAVFEFSIPVFPAELAPGQIVECSASGSGSGYMRAGYFVRTLEFRSDDVELTGKLSSGEEVHGQFGPFFTIDVDTQVWTGDSWATEVTDVPDSDSVTVQFKAPSCDWDQEFSVLVFVWNSNAIVEWVYRCEVIEPEYGVIEKDDKLYLVSPPGGALSLSLEDLPEWARSQLIVVGDLAICVGPPGHVAEGDSSILLDGKPVSRIGDMTSHGGSILDGSDRIFINGVPAAFHGGVHVCPLITPPVPHVGGRIVTSRGGKVPATMIPRLKEEVSRGSTVLEVDGEGIEIGDAVIIGSEVELTEIARVIDIGSLILDRPLKNSYPAGTLVTRVPDEFSNLVLPPTEEELFITVVEPGPEPEPQEESFNGGIPGFPVISLILGIVCVFCARVLSYGFNPSFHKVTRTVIRSARAVPHLPVLGRNY